MGSASPNPTIPWIQTPCKPSPALSREAGCNIFLKLDNLQPSGSFKSRGIGKLMLKAVEARPPGAPVHFYCSSGGNAGLACATAARELGRPATIVVPLITSPLMVEKLKLICHDVVRFGAHWSEADTYLREQLLAADPTGVYVPPFDHPHIWEGNSTLVDELEEQMADAGGYDALVCNVGGGGLFAGVMAGLERHGRLPGGHGRAVKVLAAETEGAHSLAYSLAHRTLSRLPAMTSIAVSLGATQVAAEAFARAHLPNVTSMVLADAEAAMGSVRFADDERLLVEVACGLSMAFAYNGRLRELFPGITPDEFRTKNIVLIVCGGSGVTLQLLEEYKQTYGAVGGKA